MIELRKDYVLDRWVIISEGRKDRPKEFKKEVAAKQEGVCYFCQGNEKLTPPEIGRVANNGKWKIRWFANKFPFVAIQKSPAIKKNGFYESGEAYGYHEIVVETPEHAKQFWDNTAQEMAAILNVVANRIRELSAKSGIKHVAVFKNHGPDGGTSIVHSHLQVVAYNKIPELVKEEAAKSLQGKRCLYCAIVRQEAKSRRFIAENKSFVAFAPFASRFNYEAWLFPKKHYTSITELSPSAIADLALMLKKLLGKLSSFNPSYNFYFHNTPKGKKLHFHVEITPRIATWGGFEMQTGEIVNSVSPEEAAKFYRG
ncbi:DUF4931 domain-containing protein [Candidatus Woesearchaeota archaeon]|nr:DUF4931 domain-containing protein [Candidatus Woesearchaeota archaeon]